MGESSTDDEELTVKIDNKVFPKLGSNAKRVLNSPAAINGGRLHNLSKTVYFLTYLSGKDRKIILNVDDPPGTATFESLEVYTLDSTDKLTLEPKIQAEDGDRRLILGEAENQSKETKIWMAGSILNRVKATAWPNTIHDVILQTGQEKTLVVDDTKMSTYDWLDNENLRVFHNAGTGLRVYLNLSVKTDSPLFTTEHLGSDIWTLDEGYIQKAKNFHEARNAYLKVTQE